MAGNAKPRNFGDGKRGRHASAKEHQADVERYLNWRFPKRRALGDARSHLIVVRSLLAEMEHRGLLGKEVEDLKFDATKLSQHIIELEADIEERHLK
jgi:hypothetical protein